MRIAIVISGEYRTFDVCRKTMHFIDDPRADIYFSTWDLTGCSLEIVGLDKKRSISQQHVESTIGRPCTVLVEHHASFQEKKYNSKMIHRWKKALQLVELSGVKYDWVLVVRPDLYFSDTPSTSQFLDDALAIGDHQIAWYTDRNKLQDCAFFGTFDAIKGLIDSVSIDEWVNCAEGDWHTWWSHKVPWTDVKLLGGERHYQFTFCRGIISKDDPTFAEVVTAEHDWRDAKIVQFISKYKDRQTPVHNWGDKIVERAEVHYKQGYFSKYAGKKVAVIMSGALRNFEAAAKSQHIWGKADKFLVTWRSTDPSLIYDYRLLVDVKETYLIDDDEINMVYAAPFNFNPTRMLHLWKKAVELVPNDYDVYVFARPDGFYWCTNIGELQSIIFEEKAISALQPDVEATGLNDQLFIVNKSKLSAMSDLFHLYMEELFRRVKGGENTCVHLCLWNIIPDVKTFLNTRLFEAVDCVIVRDTFRLRNPKNYPHLTEDLDSYSFNLYKAIYTDTAAWWRRTHATEYLSAIRNV